MNNMHPHWQTTDETEELVPVRVSKKKAHQVSVPAAKRSPAALFGVALIAVAGFFAFGGMDLIPAQLGTSSIKITITDSGAAPSEILVKGGKRIYWVNSSNTPQILSSPNLKDANGNLMESTAIFPGDEFVFDVPVDTPDGTYSYISQTSPAINGRIVVQKDRVTTASSSSVVYLPYKKSSYSSSSSELFASSPRPVGRLEPSSRSLLQGTAGASSAASSKARIDNVPQNPYAINNASAASTASMMPVTEHRPAKQPDSGMGLWIVSLIGLTSLMMVMRRASSL